MSSEDAKASSASSSAGGTSSTTSTTTDDSKNEISERVLSESGGLLGTKVTGKLAEKLTEVTEKVAKKTDKFVKSTDEALTKFNEKTGMQFAPVGIPLARRRQTLAVLIYSCMLFWCMGLNFWAIRYWTGLPFYLYLAYVTWKMLFQKFHYTGGLPIPWFRSWFLWQWVYDYFPVTLSKSCDLDASRGKTYVFGYHPHGIIGMGAQTAFNIQHPTKGFPTLFPGIDVNLLTLRVNFYMPFWDLFLAFMGVCDASRESCHVILSRGDSLALVLGGAKESLDAHADSDEIPLFLKDRKGFVKIALLNGASLVPVFGFGENDLYHQVANPKGSLLRNIQDNLQTKMGFALPLFRGRGIFQYNFGLLPRRNPIHVAFGEPVECPKLTNDEITLDVLNEYHQKYMDKLKQVYDQNKEKYYTKNPPELVFV